MSQEKGLLDFDHPQPVSERRISVRRRILAACFLLAPLLLLIQRHSSSWGSKSLLDGSRSLRHHVSSGQCQQVDPILPQRSSDKLAAMDEYLQSEKFKNESIARLSGAVKIPTESFDDMGSLGEDKRWDIFYDFAAYLKQTFPLTHSSLSLDLVNVHGLVYTWKGSNSSLKPTLLMAHQDVVPVPQSTVDSWTFPPFDGVFDGKFIWGRGASDCKNQLIAIMESVELLLEAGFQPHRTVILSFGFDEEVSGPQGAGHLAPFLLEKYGKDSIAAIVDEGAGIASIWGSTFATPGVTEKGYIDVEIVVRMPGGHSSIPPSHNGIGVMSELITLIEAHPYEPHLSSENPYLSLLHCGAAHSPDFPPKLKKLLHEDSKASCKKSTDKLALEAAKAGLGIRYLMQTSVAVDLISGGAKVNALPERTVATVNHRINIGSHPNDAKAKLTTLAAHVAHKYNLTLHAFPSTNPAPESPSSISLSADNHHTLIPAPTTPTSTEPVSAYAILAGTTRALYKTPERDVLVAPGIMTGNTDTRYYWDLTRDIFRYTPGWDDKAESGLGNIHTVDERVSVRAHVAAVRWFGLFVRNMDEAEVE